jgi:hypothetical protein
MKKIFIIVLLSIIILTGCNKKTTTNNREYYLSYNNKNYILGEPFVKENYGEPKNYSEVSSCAFEGLDKTYTYEHVELTTYPVDGKDKLYVIYFLDDEITTNEGIKISDSFEDMVAKYGSNYKNEGNLYTYTLGKTNLKFIIENNYITSIEYNYEV